MKDKHVIFHTKIINNPQNLQLTSKYCIVSLLPRHLRNPWSFRNGKLLAAKQVLPSSWECIGSSGEFFCLGKFIKTLWKKQLKVLYLSLPPYPDPDHVHVLWNKKTASAMHNEENFRQFCQRLVAMCSYAPSQWNGSSPQRKRTDGGWGSIFVRHIKYPPKQAPPN